MIQLLKNLNGSYYFDEKIYFRISSYKYVELKKDCLIMKSSGRECLFAYTKTINSKICFNIFNTPDLKFKENNQIKLEINHHKTLQLEINDY